MYVNLQIMEAIKIFIYIKQPNTQMQEQSVSVSSMINSKVTIQTRAQEQPFTRHLYELNTI